MKGHAAIRDALYAHLDKLIGFHLSNKTKAHKITLGQAQFDVFTDFNTDIDGKYYYRNIEVRSR